LHLQRDFSHTVCKQNVSAVRLVGLRAPVITDRSSVRLQCQVAGDLRVPLLCFQGGGSAGNPACTGRRNLKFLAADLPAIQENGKFSFVRLKNAGLFFLSVRERNSGNKNEKKSERY
jgi:hypothetical protein